MLWVTLPEGVDPESVRANARAAGIAYTPGDLFSLDGGSAASLCLAFSRYAPAELEQAIAALGAIVTRALAAGRTRRDRRTAA
jgi:2-aminoadipate transaminase